MARQPRVEYPGALYHVITRGNQRQKIFYDDGDRRKYLEILSRLKQAYSFRIPAYVLMLNHVHLLLECSHTPLAKFMQGLQQTYTQYYNRAYKKVGHLFQGRYKAILCQQDAYLLELVRYIHLNPVRSKLVRSAVGYTYSGEQAYRAGKPSAIVDPGPVLKMIGGKAGYRRFVQDGLGEGYRREYYEVEDQRFLGSEEFGERLRQEFEEPARSKKKRSLTEVVTAMARVLKVSLEVLRVRNRARVVSRQRTMVAYVLVRRGGFSVKEVAEYFGRDSTTISSLLSRYEQKMPNQPELGGDVERLAQFV